MLHMKVSRAFSLLVLAVNLSILQTATAPAENEKDRAFAEFVPENAVESGRSLRIDCGVAPLTAFLEMESGGKTGVAFSAERGTLTLRTPERPFSSIVVLVDARNSGVEVHPGPVTSGGDAIAGHWVFPAQIPLTEISNVVDSLYAGIVGVADTHLVAFNTTTTPLSDSGIIWITLPQGFLPGPISDSAYYDDDPSNDGNEPYITSVTIEGQTIKFQLNQGAQQAIPGSRIRVRFASAQNSTASGYYSTVVMTTDEYGNIDNGPGVSAQYYLSPDALDHIVILPDTALWIPSDSVVVFDVSGQDQYNNEISGLDFIYGITVDSCGEVFENSFRALKVGTCFFTASSYGIIDSSALLTVIPGPLTRFSISGYPSQTDAGIPFISPVNVTAYDIHDNIKTDFAGSVWFISSDPNATLPYTPGSPYNFNPGDSGSHNFPGSGFILRSSGLRTITATNGTVFAVSNSINVRPGVIISFDLTAGSPQIAGESFQLQASNAVDSLGNPASGEVIVADSIGGGDSPDGIPPSLNRIIVSGGSGSSFQTLTNAVPTILKGTVSGTFAVAATDTILVHPGNLGRFDMTGYPDSTGAGVHFPEPGVDVTVFDLFGNLKTNYADSVYFTSTDPQAILPYTELSKYKFQVPDSGSHTFPGADFALFTAGHQRLTVTDGVISDTSGLIHVTPGQIDNFIIFAPPNVTAGIPFTVNVTNCFDPWGNPASGTVSVIDSVGGGDSPDGTAPIYNSVRVIGGSGSANETLVNTVTTVLKGYSGAAVAVTDSIHVMPAAIGEFSLDISTPQYSGVSFMGVADVTALDSFGNIKTDFDASVDTVVISSSGGGVMANNILRQAGDFSGGVADLIAIGTTYSGRGGDMTFSALSRTGAGGISGQVDMLAVFCAGLLIDQGVVSWGDTATGAITVRNDGGVPVEITALNVFSEDGTLFDPYMTIPPLPDSLGAGQNRIYDLFIPIRNGTPVGVHPLTAASSGLFGSNFVSDTLAGYPDSITVRTASRVNYVNGSLSRDTLSVGGVYSLSLRLANTGDAGLGLIDSSFLIFSDGTFDYSATIQSGVYLPPNSPSGTVLLLDSTMVDPGFAEGDYQAKFHYFGTENGHFVADSVGITDVITVQNGARISYIAGSLNVDTLVAGQTVALHVRVSNSGSAPLAIDHGNTRIRFADSGREFVAYSDTSSPYRVDMITPGDTTFYFTPALLSAEFAAGRYRPAITMRGIQNGVPLTTSFDTSPDSVTVISRGALRIDSTYVMSRNAPFVNTAQQCSVKVFVSNLGDESVDSVYIHLTSDGFSTFADSILLGRVDGLSNSMIDYPAAASASPDSGEVFVSSVSGGVGILSGLPPSVLSPLDNAAILIIEYPADLAMSAISVSWPPGAQDDTVTVGQTVTISATVTNLGEAGISGAQSLVLDPGSSGFVIADSATRDFRLDLPIYWDITAPQNPSNSAIMTARFAVIPVDVNDGSDAVGPDSVSTIEFVVDTRPSLFQHAVVENPPGAEDGVISTNQMFIATDTLQAFGDFTDLTATIDLPYGYSTSDSITRSPTGNTVSWNIRAPEDISTDTIYITSVLYDINTGEAVSAGPDSIFLQTVRAANLGLSTRISGPQAALDGIIEPGAYLVLEATVVNEGQASAGSGRLSLHIGNPDLTTVDPIDRSFDPGVAIEWTITAPQNEISSAVPIWVTLDSIPDDENSGLLASVINDSSSVLVSVRELLPRLEFSTVGVHSGSVVRGQNVTYLAFSLRNNDRGGSFVIGATGMTVTAESRISGSSATGQNPISAAYIYSDSVEISTGLIQNDSMFFEFTDTLLIDPGSTKDLELRLTLSPQTPVTDFTLKIDDGGIRGIVLDEGALSGEIVARSSDGSPLWSSSPVAILEPSFAQSVSSYPNPFNPRQTRARIGYYLGSDSDMRIRIFTLMGELVWSKEISSSEPLGRTGFHTGDTAVIWYGENNSGYEVHTGVYICLIENLSTGEEERFKIAVVK